MINLDDIIKKESEAEELLELHSDFKALSTEYNTLCSQFNNDPILCDRKADMADRLVKEFLDLFKRKNCFNVQKKNESSYEITYGNFNARIIKKEDFSIVIYIFKEAEYTISVDIATNDFKVEETEKLVPNINQKSTKADLMKSIEMLKNNISIIDMRKRIVGNIKLVYYIYDVNNEFKTAVDVVNYIFN
jgi:hypothetical protein